MFRDRAEAGRLLGRELAEMRGGDAVVLGLPRGGVVVAFEVARLLGLPLDLIVVRKVGVPWQPELAMGAVGEDGATIVNQGLLDSARIDAQALAAAQARAWVELEHRVTAGETGTDRHPGSVNSRAPVCRADQVSLRGSPCNSISPPPVPLPAGCTR